MGKFERGKVRDAELILTKLLNGVRPSREEENHELFACVKTLEEKIMNQFPNIERATHVGDRYNLPGNIELVLEDGRVVYVEIKLVAGGVGTRANISQDSLTDLNLFEEDTISWSGFRRARGHEEWVLELLDKFENYPKDCQTRSRKRTIEKKASYLKEGVLGAKTGNIDPIIRTVLSDLQAPTETRLAASIIDKIMEEDRREKIKYIKYLERRKQNSDNIKRFTVLILAGFHSKKAIRGVGHLQLERIVGMSERGFYRVYYVNKRNLTVRVQDMTSELAELMKRGLRIFFKEEETNVTIGFEESGTETDVLRVVFHWKNIFQGIKTPCLNVFDEAYLKTTAC